MQFKLNILYSNSMKIGLLYSIIGLLIGLYISNPFTNDWRYFYLFSSFSGFITTALLWQLFIEKSKRRSLIKAVFIGLLTGILSHYVCWYLQLSGYYFYDLFFGIDAAANAKPVHPFQGLLYAFVLTLYSLMLFGWITVPAGMVLCGIFYKMKIIELENIVPGISNRDLN